MLKKYKGKIGILIIETLIVSVGLMYHTLLEFYSNNPYYHSNEIYSVVYFLEKKNIIDNLVYNRVYTSLGNPNLNLEASGNFNREDLENKIRNENMDVEWRNMDVACIKIPARTTRRMEVYIDFNNSNMVIRNYEK